MKCDIYAMINHVAEECLRTPYTVFPVCIEGIVKGLGSEEALH